MRRMRVRMMMRMLRVMRECNPLIELPNAIPWKFFPLPPTWMETLEIKVAPIFLLFNAALDMGRKKKFVCTFERVCPYVKKIFWGLGWCNNGQGLRCLAPVESRTTTGCFERPFYRGDLMDRLLVDLWLLCAFQEYLYVLDHEMFHSFVDGSQTLWNVRGLPPSSLSTEQGGVPSQLAPPLKWKRDSRYFRLHNLENICPRNIFNLKLCNEIFVPSSEKKIISSSLKVYSLSQRILWPLTYSWSFGCTKIWLMEEGVNRNVSTKKKVGKKNWEQISAVDIDQTFPRCIPQLLS